MARLDHDGMELVDDEFLVSIKLQQLGHMASDFCVDVQIWEEQQCVKHGVRNMAASHQYVAGGNSIGSVEENAGLPVPVDLMDVANCCPSPLGTPFRLSTDSFVGSSSGSSIVAMGTFAMD